MELGDSQQPKDAAHIKLPSKGMAHDSTELVERQRITEVLRKCAGNLSHAAPIFGVNRAALQTKMTQYGLRKPTVQAVPGDGAAVESIRHHTGGSV